MWVDVRTTPSVDHPALVAELDRRRRRAPPATSASRRPVEVIDDRPSVATAEDDALVRAVWDAHAAVGPAAPRLGGVPGATDGTVITSRTGMPSVVYGPGGKWIAHQADEFVEVDDLVTHAEVYVEAADRFLRRAVVTCHADLGGSSRKPGRPAQMRTASPSLDRPAVSAGTPGRATTSPTSPASPSGTSSAAAAAG